MPPAAFFALPQLLSLRACAAHRTRPFKVNVRLVRMLVTVKDANGQLIGSLNKSDFTVYDNGVQQDIAVFDRQTEQPLSVAMLVDTSASTRDRNALRTGFGQPISQGCYWSKAIRKIPWRSTASTGW